MNVVGIIPARYRSTRFAGKPLADILGKPMIQHVYERAAKSSTLEDLLVATDDERIYKAIESFGGKVVLTSPEHPTGTDRLAEVARNLEAKIIVNIQGDEPLLEPAMIDEATLPLLKDSTILMGTLAQQIRDRSELYNPNVTKVVIDRNGYALYFSRSLIPYPRSLLQDRQAPDTQYLIDNLKIYKHIGLYVYRRDFLLAYAKMEPTYLELTERLEQLRALEHGYKIKVVETEYSSIGVDTPEDLERVISLLKAQGRKEDKV